MPSTDEETIAGLRQELNDLQAAVAQVNPPLHPRTMAIAKEKIARVQGQIKELERKLKQRRGGPQCT